MASGEELTDEQWLTVESLLPKLPRRSDGRERPWRSQREVLNGALWICGAVHGGRVCPAPTEAARFASVRRFTLWLSKMAWRGARRAFLRASACPAWRPLAARCLRLRQSWKWLATVLRGGRSCFCPIRPSAYFMWWNCHYDGEPWRKRRSPLVYRRVRAPVSLTSFLLHESHAADHLGR